MPMPIRLLPNLSAAGRHHLDQAMARHHLEKGGTAVHKGQTVSGAYFVLQGRLRVYTITPDGKQATLYAISPGETCILALNSLFNDLPYPAWVEADMASEIAMVPGPVFRGLFEREKSVQDLTVKALSTIVFRLMSALEHIHAYRLDQRLAALLLEHATPQGVVRRTQQDLADHLGSTREAIARIMAAFAAQGAIRTGRGRVEILHPSQLKALLTEELQTVERHI